MTTDEGRTKCPSCGELNHPQAKMCEACGNGLTFSGRLAEPWGKSGCLSRVSCTWLLFTGFGLLFLFLFPPLGLFLLSLSLAAQFLMKRTATGLCPSCHEHTVTSKGKDHGRAFNCIRCKGEIFIDTSSGRPVFVKDPSKPLTGQVTSLSGDAQYPSGKAPAPDASLWVKRVRVFIAAIFLTVFATLLYMNHSTPPDHDVPPAVVKKYQKKFPGKKQPSSKKQPQPENAGQDSASSRQNAAGSGSTPPDSRQARQRERILSFHSDIRVMPDSSMEVKESITVRAAKARIKRGIYRDFPTRYRDRLGNGVTVGFDVVAVTRDGKKEPCHTQSISNGMRVYIGEESVFLDPGEYTYILTYRTSRQIGFFEDYDELYWNVTGNGWEFPINSASAEIHLPEGAHIQKHAAYTGPQGASGKDFSAHRLDNRVSHHHGRHTPKK